MKLVVDAQLSPALAWALRNIGEDAVAVREIGLREAGDSAIWAYALQNQAVVLTKDEDFAERLLSSREAPVIIWLRIGNTSKRALIESVLPLWPEIRERIVAGERLIEVREKIS